jgi:hypothetical protein
MELEEHHVIKFLHVKGTKLNEIAPEPSGPYDRDVYFPPSMKYWLHQIRLGRTVLQI